MNINRRIFLIKDLEIFLKKEDNFPNLKTHTYNYTRSLQNTKYIGQEEKVPSSDSNQNIKHIEQRNV